MKQPILLLLVASLAVRLGAAGATARIEHDVPYLAPYLPARPETGEFSPAMVWIHGGGWTGGEKGENRAKEICGTFAAAGYVAVSIDYQLGNGSWPTCLLDCKNAVRFLRARAAEYHIDPARIAVAGGSAGGHLALMVGFTAGKEAWEPSAPYPGVSSAVGAVVDLYGPADLLTRQATDQKGTPTGMRKLMGSSLAVFGATSNDADVLRLASPVTHAAQGMPPVLILHGKADPTVDYEQSVELDRVLTERGVPHELVLLDGIGHTFALETWNKRPLPRDLRPVVLGFLARHLRPAAK